LRGPFNLEGKSYIKEKPPTTINAAPRKSTTIGAAPNVIEDERKGIAVILPGVNVNASGPGLYETGGVEVVVLPDGRIVGYKYMGEGSSTAGGGGSGATYAGLIFNVSDPEDYQGTSSSANITIATPNGGVTGTYFWGSGGAPLSPGNVQGFTIGFAVGAQGSISFAQTNYQIAVILYIP